MKMITERLKFAEVFPDKAAAVAQRLHIKKDEIPFVRKYYTAEKDKTEVKKKERAVISYISTGIKDRDGEKLVPEGALLDNYQKNPIVPFSHDYRTVPPAKNMWIKQDEKGLIAKTVFAKNQRADDIYQAYSEDVAGTGPLLNAFSVGFIPLEWEDTDKKALEKDPGLPKRIYNKWELLEYSLVPIPSCPEALTIAIEKGLISERLKKDLEIEVVKDKRDWDIEFIKATLKADAEKMDKEIMVERDEEMITCEKCGKEFDYKKQPEIAMGAVKCPACGAIIIQTGKVRVEKDDDEILEKTLDEIISKVKKVKSLDELFTKPETTENYHRIPVNPGCKITATITISAAKGIKATYCGEVKKVHTYLFDVKKWTMEEAKAWVRDNKSVLDRYEKRLEERDMETNIVEIDDSLQEIDPEELIEEMALETDREISVEIEEEKSIVEIDELMQEIEVEELEFDESEHEPDDYADIKEMVNIVREQFEKILEEKDEHIADLKEGRVLSRKNRKIVKDAITALNAVLKADSAGSREDEESEGGGTVTEREFEVEIDGEKEFSKEDIAKIVKEVSGEQMGEILEDAFKKALDPEKIKTMVGEGIKVELQKLRGKVE